MAVYLIDFENVTSAGISGIQRLTKDDKVYIFYTVNASNMSFAAHLNLLSSPAEVVYYNVSSGGKNALDFQLASFLGYLISKGEDRNFCIISNDKGYDYVKSFWERNGLSSGVTINSSPSINRALLPMERPFASKIQQTSIPLEQLKAETDKYTSQRVTENAEKEEEKTAETVSENTEIAEINAAEAVTAEIPDPEEVMEKKPAKRRGRPKKQKAEVLSEKSANTEKESLNAASEKEKSAKSKSKAEAMSTLRKAVRPLLEKAGIKSDGDIINIANLLKSAEGKQQFYCKLTKSYGMEKGLTVYKAVRTEYTNLTKLVKQ